MSLISVHRSPSPSTTTATTENNDTDGECRLLASVATSLDVESGTEDVHTESSAATTTTTNGGGGVGKSRSLNECYFTVKGAAVILSHSDQSCVASPRGGQSSSGNACLDGIELHLQGMLRILRPEDTLSMAVRLQSSKDEHARYLALISTMEPLSEAHEAAIFGFDFLPGGKASIGITLPLLSSSRVELDGDGGISIQSCSSLHLFKPVSIQSMWTLFQNLHKELAVAAHNFKVPYFSGPLTHRWLEHYTAHHTSDDSICAQWHFSIVDEAAAGDLKANAHHQHPPPSVTGGGVKAAVKSKGQVETETLIRSSLLQIMQSSDLDDVTSRDIRNRLEEQLQRDLSDHKEFIDQEMLAILGQLDKPSRVLDYLYLGTEWNASNWEELKTNRVEYIVNVTKEVDCFFPTQFNYLKIWVSDEASTELLMHWPRAADFIREARDKGSAVLVHCKKGISRSSSTVIAYVMKEYGWSLERSLQHVKSKRNIITPNSGFMEQLHTFHGVLQASSNRHSAVFNTNTGQSSTGTLAVEEKAAGESTKERREPSKAPSPSTPPSRAPAAAKPAPKSSTIQVAKNLFNSKALLKNTATGVAAPIRGGTRRTSLVDGGGKVDGGKVKQHRFYFENRMKSTKASRAPATSFVSSIAKRISRLSLGVGSVNPKSHFLGTPTNARTISSIKANRKSLPSTASSAATDNDAERQNVVKSLVNVFERGQQPQHPQQQEPGGKARSTLSSS